MPDVSLFELFGIFFYVGLFAVGGGLVAITLLQQTVVARGLISPEQFYNMVAISESTPGPVGINMATYVGYSLYGVTGGIVATVGQVLPSIICILLIVQALRKFRQNQIMQAAFSCLRPAATGLILVAALNVFTLALLNRQTAFSDLCRLSAWQTLFNWPSMSFYLLGIGMLRRFKVHPILLILTGAAFGILFL